MCFGNHTHRCFNRWHRRSAPVTKHMKVDKVANMKVDMEVDMVVGKVANIGFLGEGEGGQGGRHRV